MTRRILHIMAGMRRIRNAEKFSALWLSCGEFSVLWLGCRYNVEISLHSSPNTPIRIFSAFSPHTEYRDFSAFLSKYSYPHIFSPFSRFLRIPVRILHPHFLRKENAENWGTGDNVCGHLNFKCHCGTVVPSLWMCTYDPSAILQTY